ncbi:helix-turn-helix domain-containing protein [Sphingobacterium endophyticum]
MNGLSQKSLAKNMGVDPVTVKRWEEIKEQG